MTKNNKSKAGQAVEKCTEGETHLESPQQDGIMGNSGYMKWFFRAIGSLTGNFPVLSYSLKVSTTVPSPLWIQLMHN